MSQEVAHCYENVVKAQLDSLDATDALASAWSDALEGASRTTDLHWGGRGRGGRGLGRRTFQPKDIVVENVCLEFVNDASVSGTGGGGSRVLLDDASLKLLHGRVYSLVARNGEGKSSLLKRMNACKIPGFPPHITSLLVPQEIFGHDDMNPIDSLLSSQRLMQKQTAEANADRIAELEEEIDNLDLESEQDQAKMEELCEQIAQLEACDGEGGAGIDIETNARDALTFFGIPESMFSTPTAKLSGGIRKKIALASALVSRPSLLLLDEPTNHLDIGGIVKLRQLIAMYVEAKATIILVSHDIDLINDVATDSIHMTKRKLYYYPGNYSDFVKYRAQGITHELKQANALERQRASISKSIDNLRKKSSAASSRETKKKINKAIDSKRKKLDRHGVEKDQHGHRWTAQSAGTGIRVGAINGIDASTRQDSSYKQLLKRTEVEIGPVPDKAVQFDFRDTTSTWGDEPLVCVMDVGHDWNSASSASSDAEALVNNNGLIFDCVDLCIREGSRTFILADNGVGKSTLLKIIAGNITPSIGTVHFASGVSIGLFYQHVADELVEVTTGKGGSCDENGIVTPLSLLSKRYPTKSEHDLRSELTNFGLSPKQAITNVQFLSGGERARLCMASMMLRDPQLLVIDEVSNHLDVESVEALIYGIKKWKGTIVMASHDANLIRSIGGTCYVLIQGGNLQRIEGGIDAYLKAFNQCT